MNKQMVFSASIAVALTMASCGGTSAPSTAAYSDQLTSVCRTIGRGIGNLDAVTSLEVVRSNATDASALYEDGVAELKKLAIPTSDKQFAADVKSLITSFEDQLDTLDGIAKAAKENDQAGVDSRISKLTDQAAESNDLADSLGISRCQLDPVFAPVTTTTTATTTTTTEPPVPLTLPIATTVPRTVPPETVPLDTTPADSNKRVVSTSDMTPVGDYTFADTPSGPMTSFETLLDLAPSMAAQSGVISGVDVIDSSGQSMGRVFTFSSDNSALTPGSFEEATPFLSNNLPTTPKTVGTLDGVTFTDPSDGKTYFLVSVQNVLLWAFSPSADLLDATLKAWGESISQ